MFSDSKYYFSLENVNHKKYFNVNYVYIIVSHENILQFPG